MLTLREANHNDEKFVNEITRKTMCKYVEEAWPDEYNREKYYKDNSFKIENTKIVCKDEVPVGRLTLVYRDHETFIDNMHIIPEMQGNGIGRWILENVINEAKQNGQSISVSVLKNNPAKRLYERVGFEIYGEANQRYLLKYKEKVL